MRAKPHTKREWDPFDVRKFGYDVSVRPPVRPDSGSRGKKLCRVGKGVPDIFALRFVFGSLRGRRKKGKGEGEKGLDKLRLF